MNQGQIPMAHFKTQIPRLQTHRFWFSRCAWVLGSVQVILGSPPVWDPVTQSGFLLWNMMSTFAMCCSVLAYFCSFYAPHLWQWGYYELGWHRSSQATPVFLLQCGQDTASGCRMSLGPSASLTSRSSTWAPSTPDPALCPLDGSRYHSWRF